MKKRFITFAMIMLSFGIMYFPAKAETSNDNGRISSTKTLIVNAFPQRYFRYRGRIYRLRYPRYRRVRRVRYYRSYRPRRIRYYRRYRRY